MWLFFKRRLKKAGWDFDEHDPVLATPRSHMHLSRLESRTSSGGSALDDYYESTRGKTGPILHPGHKSTLSVFSGKTSTKSSDPDGLAYSPEHSDHAVDHVMRHHLDMHLTPHESGQYELTADRGAMRPLGMNEMHHFAPEGHREGATYISGTGGFLGDNNYVNTAAHLFHPDTQAHAAAFLEHHPEHANNRVVVQGLTMPYRLGQVAQGEKLLRASQGEAGVPVFWPHDREQATHESGTGRGLLNPEVSRPVNLNPVSSFHGRDGSLTTSMAIVPAKHLISPKAHASQTETDPITNIIHHHAPHDPTGLVMAQGPVPPHAMLDVGHILHAHAGLNGVEGMMRIDRPDPPKGHDDEL